ncbi:MAG TPA: UDP-N-acetylmuramoyl-tripeptide--D-alanyl-D-alanine ligase [Acidimicrobiales bacterium]|nr:UDP-N-acetylmuramoyl-tripeptide--D-alanyl-D-alanine ligase [Acidimicrobiales bacterium]
MKYVFEVVLGVLLALAWCAQMLRWLRVLQREHYDPSAPFRFLGRWSAPATHSAKAPSVRREHRLESLTRMLLGRLAKDPSEPRERRPFRFSLLWIALIAVFLVLRLEVAAALVGVVYGLFSPSGLSVRGRSAKLDWTKRLRRIAIVATVLSAAIAILGFAAHVGWFAAVVAVLAVPLVLDVSTRVLAPYEERLAKRFVEHARTRLARVKPRVVAITGSYGKTSTKNYLVDLAGPSAGVVASPRSYNNRAGLSRAINEQLSDDTRVFVAEMGTYGPGEIRALCQWCPPEIAVVTAIGPVHLERMGSLDVIEAAKHEITERAEVVVVNVDDERLARWPEALRASGQRVVTAGSINEAADVVVRREGADWEILFERHTVARVRALVGAQPTNVACAMAAAWVLGATPEELATRAGDLRPVESRQNVVTAPSGVIVIDDTFNANPESARAAMALLGSLEAPGRRVVVTPGLVELGALQHQENLQLARHAAVLDFELVVVGRTNAAALAAGYATKPRRFDHRDEAVAWARGSLREGDAVLYLNDLPDHYP